MPETRLRWLRGLVGIAASCPFLCAAQMPLAPADTTGRPRVRIERADAILRSASLPGVQRLVGDVVLGYRQATLRCDSAWRFDDGRFQAMGGVGVTDPQGFSLAADEVLMDPTTDKLTATGRKAQLTDGTSWVKAPRLEYHVVDRVARFAGGGVIETGAERIAARHARYDLSTRRLQLGGAVVLETPDEIIRSDSMHIDRSPEAMAFLGATRVVRRDGSFEMRCQRGRLDAGGAKGWLTGRADLPVTVRQGADALTADTVTWSGDLENPGPGSWRTASGRVVLTDTLGQRELTGGHLRVWQEMDSTEIMQMTGRESRVQLRDATQDEPTLVHCDTLIRYPDRVHAYPHVIFEQGEIVGACDTLLWWEVGERLEMRQEPALWLEGQTLQADTIVLAQQPDGTGELRARGHAFAMTPALDSAYHQVAGRVITGLYADRTLHTLLAEGNGEVLYLVESEGPADPMLTRATCSRLRIDLEAGTLRSIALLDAPTGVMQDWSYAPPEDRSIPGCVWRDPPPVQK